MADPFTVAGGALIGAGATLLGAAVTGTVGVGKLAYDIHKDRKEAKRNGGSEAATVAHAKKSYNPNLVYQPSASYQKSGTEQISFGPDGKFTAIGTNPSDWSCGTITFYAPSEQGGETGEKNKKKKNKARGQFGESAPQPPPPYR